MRFQKKVSGALGKVASTRSKKNLLEGAADPVPGVDGSDGPEGHGQEGGLEKFARGGVSDEDSGVLKMITQKRASSIGRCEVALQEDEAFHPIVWEQKKIVERLFCIVAFSISANCWYFREKRTPASTSAPTASSIAE